MFTLVCYSPAAVTKWTDDEFMMFDEDISVKMPLSLTSMIKRVTGERNCF